MSTVVHTCILTSNLATEIRAVAVNASVECTMASCGANIIIIRTSKCSKVMLNCSHLGKESYWQESRTLLRPLCSRQQCPVGSQYRCLVESTVVHYQLCWWWYWLLDLMRWLWLNKSWWGHQQGWMEVCSWAEVLCHWAASVVHPPQLLVFLFISTWENGIKVF